MLSYAAPPDKNTCWEAFFAGRGSVTAVLAAPDAARRVPDALARAAANRVRVFHPFLRILAAVQGVVPPAQQWQKNCGTHSPGVGHLPPGLTAGRPFAYCADVHLLPRACRSRCAVPAAEPGLPSNRRCIIRVAFLNQITKPCPRSWARPGARWSRPSRGRRLGDSSLETTRTP